MLTTAHLHPHQPISISPTHSSGSASRLMPPLLFLSARVARGRERPGAASAEHACSPDTRATNRKAARASHGTAATARSHCHPLPLATSPLRTAVLSQQCRRPQLLARHARGEAGSGRDAQAPATGGRTGGGAGRDGGHLVGAGLELRVVVGLAGLVAGDSRGRFLCMHLFPGLTP
jgi:hypothetical protein